MPPKAIALPRDQAAPLRRIDDSPERKAKPMPQPKKVAPPPTPEPRRLPPPAPKKKLKEKSYSSSSSSSEEEEEPVVVKPTKDYFTEKQLIEELTKQHVALIERYHDLWEAMENPDTTWEAHLYELYLFNAKRNLDATVTLMKTELQNEENTHKKGNRKKAWRIRAELPDAFSELSLGSVCVVCFENKCKHQL
jgi:hypothetical protein